MPLEKELATYKREHENLLAHEGKFVVIGGDVIAGFYDTYVDALRAGYDRFGLDSFMVKQILAFEPVHEFTRDIPCPT
jgi:hypothetical protein